MIERHWDGIAAYCKPENKFSLGFVEGLNNKIRVIQLTQNSVALISGNLPYNGFFVRRMP